MDETSGDLPMGALGTLADAKKALENGKPLWLVLPSFCVLPRLEKHTKITKRSKRLGLWSLYDRPLRVPFTSSDGSGEVNGYIFDNYWFAYAYNLRTSKCK